ncbi:MAG: hypothetical protein L6407_05265 [Candidatus Delongbacteria bacterium]|nr:hypothetical protein [Candidatus Delongbacteria bacterium]
MKFILLFGALLFSTLYSSQSTSCSDLVSYAKSEDPYPDRVSPYGSTMIAKAEFYQVEGGGLVIAYLKSNEYDYSGKPYIFCGISRERWAKFKSVGMYDGWGEAFHQYIMDHTCDCN